MGQYHLNYMVIGEEGRMIRYNRWIEEIVAEDDESAKLKAQEIVVRVRSQLKEGESLGSPFNLSKIIEIGEIE